MAVRKILGVEGGQEKTVLRVTDAVPTNGQVLKYNTTDNAYAPADDAVGGGAGQVKAGTVLKASFAGKPATYSVAFGTAMPDANYAVTFGQETGIKRKYYLVNYKNRTASGFDIIFDVETNKLKYLISVSWIAAGHGS